MLRHAATPRVYYAIDAADAAAAMPRHAIRHVAMYAMSAASAALLRRAGALLC